ncbi:zinc-dependent metalloprotease [Kineococcus rhizosphaerae]|uniref:Uncharacterized protein DUF4953 n=1 Tax=Kineococcus rhizosphaerae TaxID=559628 RepID=A0A2T0R1A2_9ACTN|nr:zinc-dependent metalloprotease [Kineococcus rhizosphaerae]PRY13067.1 uncharacterized protein DUF4953 [Kineococcus rhizosphaerae]
MSLPFTVRGTRLVDPVDGERFLLATTVGHGLGSSRLRLDRGQPGEVRLVRVEVRGGAVRLVQESKHHLGAGSFAESTLFAGPLVDGAVDVEGLLVSDLHGVAGILAAGGHGDHRFDTARSHLAEVRVSAEGAHWSTVLTLTGPGTSAELVRVVPDARWVTVGVEVTAIPLPDEGFVPRRYDPASGSYAKGHADHDRIGHGVEVRFQPRFRTDRTVVFHVDPRIPQPYRDAVVEGGRWWRQAFAAAGLPDAFDVRVRADDVDAFGPRTSSVSWVHRAGRGWSQGGALTDPRTQEILRGQVRLGSHRVEQLTLLAEALLTPYGRPDEAERLAAVERFVLARLRHLAAHEIGHALGFVHNYASTKHAKPSVMDYPHPRLRLRDGRIDLAGAYSAGVGPWDEFLVRHGYADDETPSGLVFVTDADGHAPDAAHPDAVPWTSGDDPFTTLAELLEVREVALGEFSRGALARDRQVGDLEPRLVVLHLLHRHEVAALARLVGGVAHQGSPDSPAAEAVAPDDQRRAVEALLPLLDAEVAGVPASAVAVLLPPPPRFERDDQTYAPRTGPVFDPVVAVAAGAAVVLEPLLEPARLNRLHEQAVPGLSVEDLVGRVLRAAANGEDRRQGEVAGEAVRRVVATLTSGRLHDAVADEVHAALLEAARAFETSRPGLARRLHVFGEDGTVPGTPAVLPPGAPW